MIIHEPNYTKVEQEIAVWRWGFDSFPDDILGYITFLPALGRWVLLNPNNGVSTVFDMGWHICQTKHGCLYATPHESFRNKYRATRKVTLCRS